MNPRTKRITTIAQTPHSDSPGTDAPEAAALLTEEPAASIDASAPALNAPSTAGMTTKVVKGSLWTLAGQVAPLAVSLVATPFTIRLLGAEGYGVLILVGLIPTYLGFADLGMGIASTKFGSEAYAAGNAEKEARTVRTAAVLSLFLSVPFGIAIFALSGWLVTLFNVPEHLVAEASLALKVAAFTFVLNFLNQIFNTPQLDRLRMDLNTFVTSGFRIIGIAATPIVIYLGGGILGAVTVLFIASLATLAGHIYVSGRLLPKLYDLSLDRTIIRPMLKFGIPVGLTLIAASLLINLEKVVLARVTDLKTLAYYAVAFNFAGLTTLFSMSMIQSLTPAFAQLLTPDRRNQLNRLYARAVRLNVVVIVPFLVLMFVVARPMFTVWAGPDFGRESTLPFHILLFGLFFNMLAYVSQALLLAAGRTDVIAKVNWAEVVPYIGLTAILSYKLGAVGAALAWSLRVFVDCFVIIWLADRLERTRLPIGAITSRLLVGLALFTPALLFSLIVGNWSLWLPVILTGSCILYFGFVWKFAIESEERIFLTVKLRAFLTLFGTRRANV